MTVQQQSELLEIMIDNSSIFDEDHIVTTIFHYRKNYSKILKKILTIVYDINSCTNDLLKAIILNGWRDVNGVFCSIAVPKYEYYEELKKLIEERKKNGNITTK